MRTFIFILMLMFAGPSLAQETHYYGDHKNDQCVSWETTKPWPWLGELPYSFEPSQCFYEENEGCCVWTDESWPWNETWCYEYRGEDRCLWNTIKLTRR